MPKNVIGNKSTTVIAETVRINSDILEENQAATKNYVDSKEYTHRQISAQSNWVIEHNLGRKPSVTVVDSAGSTCIGEVKYIDNNTLELSFTAEFSGFAYLN